MGGSINHLSTRHLSKIRAVAFDLDGTLYPNYRFYRRLIPFLLTYPRLFSAFAKVRGKLHCPDGTADLPFYEKQAALLAELLGQNAEEVREKVERLVYRGWESLFLGVKTFPHVRETLSAFREAGLKLAVLSDFPPVRKISLLGLDSFFETLLSSEDSGALKPSSVPFTALAQSLKLEAPEILYVGNSPRYDAAGARRAGMKTALIKRGVFSTGRCRNTEGADFIFRNYRQLREYVLGLMEK